MSCYQDARSITRQSFNPEALDTVLEQHGSETYISMVVRFALHGSRFEVTDRLINYATELINWNNPPEPLVGLLEMVDHEGALKTADPTACRELCFRLARINNMPTRLALLAVFAYYLQTAENTTEEPAYKITEKETPVRTATEEEA